MALRISLTVDTYTVTVRLNVTPPLWVTAGRGRGEDARAAAGRAIERLRREMRDRRAYMRTVGER